MDNEISRKLETMIPLDLYKRLLIFAQENASTGLGKWDFGVALRILLDRSKMMEWIDELTDRMDELELQFQHIKNNPIKKEDGVATFGGNKK